MDFPERYPADRSPKEHGYQILGVLRIFDNSKENELIDRTEDREKYASDVVLIPGESDEGKLCRVSYLGDADRELVANLESGNLADEVRNATAKSVLGALNVNPEEYEGINLLGVCIARKTPSWNKGKWNFETPKFVRFFQERTEQTLWQTEIDQAV